jgi:eukaryotic-like serine/threonine-protein kinase
MAEVLLGRLHGPRGFARAVVLKRILPHMSTDASLVAMFFDEASINARLHHANVVQVHELVQDRDELFMVMEYLAGESFAGLVRRLISRDEAFAPWLAAHVVAEACAGLHAAHELRDEHERPLNVVHRDVSPHNLFVTFDGNVKVLDFGIARAADRGRRTEPGEVKGKLEYMSPEQCRGEALDRRADIFSLGVVLYELMTLRRLFKRATPLATLRAITEEGIVPPSRLVPGCPKALEVICLKALEMAPGDRYATMADMRRDLIAASREPAGQLPEEALAARMVELFAERKVEKEEMLRRVAEGVDADVPAGEVDEAVDVPTVLESQTRLWRPRARSRAILATIMLAVIVVLTGGAASASRWPTTAVLAPTPSRSAPTMVHRRRVTVWVESTPAGAEVWVNGSLKGAAPQRLVADAGTAALTVEARLHGYRSRREELAVHADRTLTLDLVREPSLASTRGSQPSGTSSPSPDPLHQKW